MGNEMVPAEKPMNEIMQLIEEKSPMLMSFLPSGLKIERFKNMVITAIAENMKILNCTKKSILLAVFQAAKVGLEPGMQGECSIIPYGDKASFVPGYMGLARLMQQHEAVQDIDAHWVYEKDEFHYEYGTEPKIKHIPYDGPDDPGALIKSYAIVWLKSGAKHFIVLNQRDIDRIRGQSKSTAWKDHPQWMWAKSAVKQVSKLIPKSYAISKALLLDDQAEIGVPQRAGIEGEEIFLDVETPLKPESKTEEVKEKLRGRGRPKKAEPPSTEPVAQMTSEEKAERSDMLKMEIMRKIGEATGRLPNRPLLNGILKAKFDMDFEHLTLDLLEKIVDENLVIDEYKAALKIPASGSLL